jgi:hypothetical protein
MPALHRLFAPLGLDMLAASFDSLLCLFEYAAGRPLAMGASNQRTADEIQLCALLTWAVASGPSWKWDGAEDNALAPTIECAAASTLLLAGVPKV